MHSNEARSAEKVPKKCNPKTLVSESSLQHGVQEPKETGQTDKSNPKKDPRSAYENNGSFEKTKLSVHAQGKNQKNEKRKPVTHKEEPQIKISNKYELLLSKDDNETRDNSKELKKRKTEFVDEISPKESKGINEDVIEKEKSRFKVFRESKSQEEKEKMKEREGKPGMRFQNSLINFQFSIKNSLRNRTGFQNFSFFPFGSDKLVFSSFFFYTCVPIKD